MLKTHIVIFLRIKHSHHSFVIVPDFKIKNTVFYGIFFEAPHMPFEYSTVYYEWTDSTAYHVLLAMLRMFSKRV
jgi:hypothetical protein